MTRKVARPDLSAPPLEVTDITTLLEEDAELTERPAEGKVSGSRAGERYRLCFEIASGGMATVYLAMMEGPGGFSRPVALKRIHEHLARQPEFVRMFQDEARISALVVHPNVCQVYDFGSTGDRHYLAMEYLVGETLSRIVPEAIARGAGASQPRFRAMVGHLLAEACEGLHAAHVATGPDGSPLGIVHRDVSPRNLLVTFDGRMKVLDFGIAHAAGRTERTRTGHLKGSLAYVSPEQVQATPTDARSDLWSVGVCLWECLAGRRLFRRDSAADTLYAVAHEAIPSLADLCPDLPAPYVGAVDRALRRAPEDRWPNARAFAQALRDAVRSEGEEPSFDDVAAWMRELFPEGPTRARELLRRASDARVSIAPAAPRRGRRVLVGLALGGGAVALLAGGVGVGLVLGDRDADLDSELDSEPDPPPAATRVAAARDGGEATASADAGLEDAGALARDGGARPRAARRRRRRSVGAADATGTVNVVVPDGWAIVLYRGRRLGQTPRRVELPAGRHTLELRFEGRRPGRRVRVDVTAGETTPLVVRQR